jgi:hypothetical protein
MGGVSWCPIGEGNPQVKGHFPRGTYLIHVVSVRWVWRNNSRCVVLDIQGFVFSFMGAFLEGVPHPSFSMQSFSKT